MTGAQSSFRPGQVLQSHAGALDEVALLSRRSDLPFGRDSSNLAENLEIFFSTQQGFSIAMDASYGMAHYRISGMLK